MRELTLKEVEKTIRIHKANLLVWNLQKRISRILNGHGISEAKFFEAAHTLSFVFDGVLIHSVVFGKDNEKISAGKIIRKISDSTTNENIMGINEAINVLASKEFLNYSIEALNNITPKAESITLEFKLLWAEPKEPVFLLND